VAKGKNRQFFFRFWPNSRAVRMQKKLVVRTGRLATQAIESLIQELFLPCSRFLELFLFIRRTWCQRLVAWCRQAGWKWYLLFSRENYFRLSLTMYMCDKRRMFSCRPFGVRWSGRQWESEEEAKDRQKKSNYKGNIFLLKLPFLLFLLLLFRSGGVEAFASFTHMIIDRFG